MAHYLQYTVEQLIQQLLKYPPHYLVAADFDDEISGAMTISIFNPADINKAAAEFVINGNKKED